MSRRARPKQLLSLFTGMTLLESTLHRLSGLVPLERTFILTNSEQEEAVRRLLPMVPAANIIAEPEKRDTAAAIALGVGLISRRDRGATMVVLPADQLIKDVAGFQKAVKVGVKAAEQTDDLVTMGVKPTWPCPFFGYIERGRQVAVRGTEEGEAPVYEVLRFREKPAVELAESFLRDGCFRWNAGMFIWTIPSILREFERHVPALATFISRLHDAAKVKTVIEGDFATLPKVSIDYAVMEKASRMLEVEADFDWDDVGNWIAASKYWENDSEGNAANIELTSLDATNNIVFSDPRLAAELPEGRKMHVALVGVDDIIVVQTRDAILVCNRHEADKIKQVLTKVPREML